MNSERTSWLISGGRLVDPSQGIDEVADVLVVDGRVAEVRRAGKTANTGTKPPAQCGQIDAGGHWIVPGLIDLHAHFREPGYEYQETIQSGAQAAVAGGFTTVCCMPNTDPINDNRSVADLIFKQAAAVGLVNLHPIGAITKGSKGETLADIGELLEAGCVAVSDDGRPVMNSQVMRRAMDYVRGFDGLVIDHCEDLNLSAGGSMHEGCVSLQLGLHGIPSAAEEAMVGRDLALVELTGCRFHVAHVSSAGSVRMIRHAKAQGLPVTAETCPHYLALTDEAVVGYNTHAKMNPPLGDKKARETIIEGLCDGTIDAIATDHAPHAMEEKEQEFDRAHFGIVGLETAFAISYGLVREGLLTRSRLIEAFTIGPASVIRSDRGTLAPGAMADLTIIDPEQEWVVDSKAFRSKGSNSPFQGWTLRSRVISTMVGGRMVYEQNGSPSGKNPQWTTKGQCS